MLPWIQTASRRRFPLINPKPEDVHWPDVAFHLAHINRFAGAGGCYSVAQHLVYPLSFLREKDRGYWLLHDAHEFAISDIPTPVVLALDEHMASWKGIVRAAVLELKNTIDGAIHNAAGLSWPPPEDVRAAIKHIDEAMLMTECRDVLGGPAGDWGFSQAAFPFTEKIVPWASAETAYTRFGKALGTCFGISVPPMYDVRPFVAPHG